MQYFSKWRKEWVCFTPTQGQLIEMYKYNYKIRTNEKGKSNS